MADKKQQGLSHSAYGGVSGDDYIPYIPANQAMPELNVMTILVGIVFAVIFGAANTYLGLKVGMTIAAGIPAAIIATTVLKALFKRNNILEANMIQSMAAMGESLAGGLIFTIPAVIILGSELKLSTIVVVAALGGLLGIFFVVPLRRYLIVEEHGKLVYPEAMATSEVLVSSSEGGKGFATIMTGLGVGAGYKLLSDGFKLWKSEPEWTIKGFGTETIFGYDAMASLIGVGFIVGLEISMYMFAGALVAWFGLIPLIKYMGATLVNPIFPATIPISQMDAWTIWSKYVRYIGAGAVAAGGFISIIKSMPTIVRSFRAAIKGIGAKGNIKRTELDIPLTWVIGGSVLVFLLTWFLPMVEGGFVGSLVVFIAAFFFSVVSARLVGLIGTSNNPISGMTIASLLIITSVLKATGTIGDKGMIIAIVCGGIVCVAIAMAGGAAQSLKATQIIGGTPKKVQIGMYIATICSAAVIGLVILMFVNPTTIAKGQVSAPQATIMSMIVKGIMTSQLPWVFVLIGATFGVVVELLGVPVLPFALGLYLPIHLSAGVLIGGIIRWLLEKKFKNNDVLLKDQAEKGVLLSSGLVAGDAIMGIFIGLFAYLKNENFLSWDLGKVGEELGKMNKTIADILGSSWTTTAIILVFVVWVYRKSIKVDKTV